MIPLFAFSDCMVCSRHTIGNDIGNEHRMHAVQKNASMGHFGQHSFVLDTLIVFGDFL
jgi:hypothetical protein